MTPTYKPGDLVTRTGESAMGVTLGETYTVKSCAGRDDRWLTLVGVEGEFWDKKFRPAEEGKP